MKRVTYDWRERLDTGLGSLFPFYLLGAIGFLLFGPGLLAEYLLVGALTFVFFMLACPWLPGERGLTKVILPEVVLAGALLSSEIVFAGNPALRSGLIIAMATLLVYSSELGGLASTMPSDLDPFLARLGIGALGNVNWAGTREDRASERPFAPDSLSLGDRCFAGARKTRRSRAAGGDSAHGSAWAQKSGAGLWRCREEPAGWRVVRRRPALYFASPPPSTRLRLPRCRTTPRELESMRAPTLADDERPAHAVNTIQHIANRAAGVGEGAKRSKAEAGPSSRRPRRILEHCPGEGTPISDRPSHERRPLPDSGRARTETDHARNAVIS